MLKRISLTMTLITTFVVAGFMFANRADAWRYGSYAWGRPYASYYYGPRVANYGYYAPYRTYYYGPGVYGPRVVARPYYNAYYRPGVYFGPVYR